MQKDPVLLEMVQLAGAVLSRMTSTKPPRLFVRTSFLTCVGFVAGFVAALGGLSATSSVAVNPPPASPEFAEFWSRNATWSNECESFIDKKSRAYNAENGVLTYAWLGTDAQKAACWNGSPPFLSVIFVADKCVECSDPPPDNCQVHLRGTDIEGFTPQMMLIENYVGDRLEPRLNQVAIWGGTTAQLGACERYASIGSSAFDFPQNGASSRSFSIALDTELE